MKTMTISGITLAITATTLASACNATEEAASNGGENRLFVQHQGLADLPHLQGRAVKSPYVRYSETTHQAASQGLVIFLYPLVRRRSEFLAVEYQPGTSVSGDFSGDIVGGMGGLVTEANGQVSMEELPISLPVGVGAHQQWHLRYAERDFDCTSRAGANGNIGQIAISCISPEFRLNLIFDREHGVTEFQRFCGRSICTYRLMDSQGLLSTGMLDYMRLPRI